MEVIRRPERFQETDRTMLRCVHNRLRVFATELEKLRTNVKLLREEIEASVITVEEGKQIYLAEQDDHNTESGTGDLQDLSDDEIQRRIAQNEEEMRRLRAVTNRSRPRKKSKSNPSHDFAYR